MVIFAAKKQQYFMMRVLRIFWLACCIAVIAAYLTACLSPYVPPSSASFISLFALVFPFLFTAAMFCTLTIFFIKKGAAFLTAVLLILAGYTNLRHSVALHPGKWQIEKGSNTLRIMTWNVEEFLSVYPLADSHAAPRRDMYSLIKQYNPDVLCVQEFKDLEGPGYPSFRKELADMGYQYMYISNDSINDIGGGNKVYRGSAIIMHTAAIDSGRINIRNIGMNENMVYSDVMFNNRRLRIFSGHLASLNLYSDTIFEPVTHDNIYEKTYKRKRKIEYRYREGEITHEKQVAFIQSTLRASPYPVTYCGDNNAPPTSYAYNYLTSNLQDAFLKKGFGLGGTFYKISPTLRIDVCLVNNQCNIQQCTVPQVKLSDHYPIVTDINWKNE